MAQTQQQESQHNNSVASKVSLRAYPTYGAHLFKALFRRYHKELAPILRQHISEESCIMDVGAHAGQFAKLFAELAPKGQIHAFEPAKYTRSILSCVKALHRLNSVKIVPLGLGDAAGELTLNIPIKSSGSLGYGLSHIGDIEKDSKRPTYQETISIVKLDDYIAENNIAKVDFIKADIEGWELRMLMGAEKTLSQHRPALLLEIHDEFLGRAGDSAADMLTFLKKHNYDIFIIENEAGTYALRDMGNNPKSKDLCGDILCVPQSE